MDETDASKSVEEVSLSDLSAPARLAVRKELRRLEALLDPDEVVVAMARGAYRGRFGVVAVTRKRVIFVDRAKIHSQTASFSLGRLYKVDTGTTPMGYGRLELYMRTDDLPQGVSDVPSRLRFKVVPKSKAEEIAQVLSAESGGVEIEEVGMVADESTEAPSVGGEPGDEDGAAEPSWHPS